MSALRAWGLRLTGLFDKESKDRELAAELESHLQMHIEDNVRRGVTAEAARRDALMQLGGLDQAKEKVRERRGVPLLESLLHDVRFGLRMLRKSPGFTVVAVLTLALGIGATTAVFSVVNAVMIRSLPYREPGRLVYVWTPVRSAPQFTFIGPTNADFFDIQRQQRSFSTFALAGYATFNLASQRFAQRVTGLRVTASFFPTLGVAPAIGRVIDAADDQPGHERVAVISYALWQSQFAGTPDLTGKTVLLDGQGYQVIGAMPPDFRYPRANDFPYSGTPTLGTALDTQVWVPAAITPEDAANRTRSHGFAIGRLRRGVTVQQAQAEMSTIMTRLDNLHNNPNLVGWYAVVMPITEPSVGDVRLLLWVLFGAVALVLMIACSNVTSMLLARLTARTHEMATRIAMGANRARLVRQMLNESVLLTGTGGVLGIAAAYGVLRLLLKLDPGDIPRLGETSLDARVLLFGLGVSLLVGISFGVLPALTASRAGISELLKQSGRRGLFMGAGGLGRGLLVGQVALAVLLLMGAGLLVRSYLNLQRVELGYSPESTVTMNLTLDSRYTQMQQRQAFFGNVLDKIGALPGVESAGAVDNLPQSRLQALIYVRIIGDPDQKDRLMETSWATPGYFRAIGIPLVAGRGFTDDDTFSRPAVAIVNERFAQLYFAGQDPVGKHIRLTPDGADPSHTIPWRTVVGVIADVRHSNSADAVPGIYVPFWQWWDTDRAFIAVRTTIPPDQLTYTIRKTVQSIDPALAVADIRTMNERISEANARSKFQASLLGAFSITALALAAVGLYGLLAYSVRQRTTEIGIRVALGARPAAVLLMFIQDGLKFALLGTLVGIGLAVAFTRLLSTQLFGIKPTDPQTLLEVSFLLLGVALLACYVPARRATKVDPMVALRYE